MPPSSKRSQRRRGTRDASHSPTVPEQSSPTRPAKRRRKLQEPPSEPIEEEGSSLSLDASGADGAPSADDRLVTQVTQHLRTIPTHAAKEHANAIQSSTQDIEAYAKISAFEWTYYIRSLSINIGRSSDNENRDPSDPDFVHIDLGPSKTFSRQTAVIYFDPDAGKWFIQARGRNGLKVDNEPLKKSDTPHGLLSGEVIEIGGLEMMFVMPPNISPLHIHSSYLEQAGLATSSRNSRTALPPHPAPDASSSQPVAAPSSSRGQSFQQPIAPAPPDYKRPGTPPSARSRPPTSHAKTPAQASTSALVMSQSDIDLSTEENKHIKPAFSYAQMITQAIMSTPEEKLNLAGIYQYIQSHYAYYRNQPAAGWQNSIRHNLSLNKSFSKAPRSTDEPGKGMKWELVPDMREDMIRGAYKGGRGGHRGSSAPSSPSQSGQVTYITAGPKEMASRGEPASARKRRVSPDTSPPPRSSLNMAHVTPDRRLLSKLPGSAQDGSPLPRRGRNLQQNSSFGTDLPRSPPTLSSSYLHDEGTSFATPAPHKVNLRLAPPSTAQRPSQNMPISSPAPFWKFAEVNSTPLKLEQFDMSPLKPLNLPHSSSPPPPRGEDRSPVPSPSRPTRVELKEKSPMVEKIEKLDDNEEEEGGFDLTKYGPRNKPLVVRILTVVAGDSRASGHTIASAAWSPEPASNLARGNVVRRNVVRRNMARRNVARWTDFDSCLIDLCEPVLAATASLPSPQCFRMVSCNQIPGITRDSGLHTQNGYL
ncbi:hypothetical protein GGR56DRAFT_626331 [Xylariaceae sp. FL0804]|nr:hypothetical protein GGR56DRAFT_626331 [Xylariaceae sp. FL0804]